MPASDHAGILPSMAKCGCLSRLPPIRGSAAIHTVHGRHAPPARPSCGMRAGANSPMQTRVRLDYNGSTKQAASIASAIRTEKNSERSAGPMDGVAVAEPATCAGVRRGISAGTAAAYASNFAP